MRKFNNKGISTSAIILIVVVILLAGGVVWWELGKNTNITNSNSNANIAVNSNANKNINNGNGNSNINSNDQSKTYINNTYGFSIKYPQSWDLIEKNVSSSGYLAEKWIVSIDKISKTGSYPDPKRPLDISVGIGILENKDNKTLDQIFEEEYKECQKDEENVMGCPRQFYGVQWKESTIDGHPAFQSGIVGPIINNDNIFIMDGDYYIHINGFYYKQNDVTVAEFKEIFSSLVFNK